MSSRPSGNHGSSGGASNTPRDHSKKNRFKVLIYPAFQLKLLGIQFAVTLVSFAAIALFVGRSYAKLISLGQQVGMAPNHPYFRFLEYQEESIRLYVFGGMLVGFVITAITTLILSQKLAGPILRLKSFFGRIQEQGLSGRTPLKFREGDFFYDLPTSINGAFDKVSEKLNKPASDNSAETAKRKAS